MNPLRLRVATANPGKAEEIRRLLTANLGPDAALVRVEGAGDLGLPPAAEDGDTYAANALLKARPVAAADPAAAVLADDSGLEVVALGGAPGLLSARWAVTADGRPLDGAGLNAALLGRLSGLPAPERAARMVCAVALLLPDGQLLSGWGEVRGSIALEARGGGGFGYDAVFLLPDGRRLSEVEPAVKDRLGHRGQAVRALVPGLRRHLTWVAGGRR